MKKNFISFKQSLFLFQAIVVLVSNSAAFAHQLQNLLASTPVDALVLRKKLERALLILDHLSPHHGLPKRFAVHPTDSTKHLLQNKIFSLNLEALLI